MKKANALCILVSLASVLCFLFLTGQAQAQTFVTCTGSGTPVQDAINVANSGDTILVSGTCSENVVIGAYQSNITLGVDGTATIDGPNSYVPTINVLGREIVIAGFTISGGVVGINVAKGGTAVISNNTIENTGSTGIAIIESGFARILNNTIQDNPIFGITLSGCASAYIGINTPPGDPAVSPNAIQSNGNDGIYVAGSSSAWIVGNLISNNTNHGIRVDRVSQANISGNLINGNGLNGILVTGNSGANLGSDTGTLPANLPNTTTVVNGKWGIDATIGSYVDGRRGSLRGVKGRISVSANSINSTIP